jgi:hypothetical protein
MILIFFVLFVALTAKIEYIDNHVEKPLCFILNVIWVCAFAFMSFFLMAVTRS